VKQTIVMGILTRAAAIAPASIDQERRTVELVWSTGAAVKRADWVTERTYMEELSMAPAHVRMERLNGGAPLLNSHGRWGLTDVLGVVEKAWLDGGEGRAIVRFSARPDADAVWNDVRDGIIRNVSVGYKVHRFEETSKPGAAIPTFLAVDWEPEEISLVSVGADAGAGVRADSGGPCEVEFRMGGEPAEAPPPAAVRSMEWVRKRLDLAEREDQ
jgi:hypothetical protein